MMYEEWYELQRRRATCIRERLCTCCAFIWRAGDPRATSGACGVRVDATNAGSRELLCSTCLGYWRQNAADDPQLEPTELVMLAAPE